MVTTVHWADSSGRIQLDIPLTNARAVLKPGDATDAVNALIARPMMRRQLEAVNRKHMRRHLWETGAWDAREVCRAPDAQNLQRLVWLAACDVAEEDAAARRR